MALTTYDELKASVASWINRTNLTDAIPDFIVIAESRIDDQLRIRQGLVADHELTTVVDSDAVSLPADWLEFDGLRIDDAPLEFITIDRLRQRSTSGTSTPTMYSIRGDKLFLSPKPGATQYTIVCDYYAKLPRLSATNSSNWLLEKNPNIYLYGSLVSAYQYLLNEKMADYYGNLYTQSIDLAKAADLRALSSGSPWRMRQR